MICEECGNVMSQDDIDKGMCPFCYQRGTSIGLDNESIAELISKEWGFDFDIALQIVLKGDQKLLDRCMFITCEGEVKSTTDEEELRLIMLYYLLDNGSLSDIEYVFVDGEQKGIEIDIKFTKQDKDD